MPANTTKPSFANAHEIIGHYEGKKDHVYVDGSDKKLMPTYGPGVVLAERSA